jgi:hypothetical protein
MDKIRNSKNYLADKTKSKGSQILKETNKRAYFPKLPFLTVYFISAKHSYKNRKRF